ncbi:MAG: type II secretion system F family protein [Dethiobacteria bacterium]
MPLGVMFMPEYYYRARDLKGTEKEGVVVGDKPLEAIRGLQERGYYIVRLRERGGRPGERNGEAWRADRAFSSRYNGDPERSYIERVVAALNKPVQLPFIRTRLQTRDMAVFCRQFATMVGAGITFLYSLKVLARQTEQPQLKEIIGDIAARVEKGFSLGDSFKAHSGIFSDLMVNMVIAGESGGVLDTVLDRLAVHFEKQYDLEQKIRSATLYPRFLFCAAILVVVFMLVFVIPSFQGIYVGMAVDLPPLTELLILLGEGLVSYWYLFFLLTVAFAFLLKRILSTGRGAFIYDWLLLELPLFNALYKKVILARFCRTLGTLLGSGVNLLLSLQFVERILGNRIAGAAVRRVAGGIAEGRALAEALALEDLFPSMVAEMAGVGEETGKLDEMLIRSADYYEEEVSCIIERLGSMLEPILILAMAGIVGLIALSVLLPVFDIYRMI